MFSVTLQSILRRRLRPWIKVLLALAAAAAANIGVNGVVWTVLCTEYLSSRSMGDLTTALLEEYLLARNGL